MSNLTNRRHCMNTVLGAGICAAAALNWPSMLRAQTRTEPWRMLCGYPPGGSVDVVARKLSEHLAAGAAVVDNKPGAAGRLVVDELKKAGADAPVLLVTPASVLTMYPYVFRNLSYDPQVDLTPVGIAALTGFALAVGPKVPEAVSDVASFAAWCKQHPEQAACGNAGAGSMPHFMAVILARAMRLELNHVPYRGGTAAMRAAAAGDVAAAIGTESSALALAQAGKLRVIATSGQQRSPFLAQAPSFLEQGLTGLAMQEWFGVFLPPKASAERVGAVHRLLTSALQSPAVTETWKSLALTAEPWTPEKLTRAVSTELAFWGPLIKASGFMPEA